MSVRPATSDTPALTAPIPVYRRRAFLVGGGVLMLLLAITQVVLWTLGSLTAEEAEQHQQQRVTEALDYIVADFRERQEVMTAEATALMQDPAFRENVLAWVREGDEGAYERLVTQFAALDLPLHVAVELYDPTPQLVLWSGPSIPPDRGPDGARFLEAVQTAVVNDSGKRQVLVLWQPLLEGDHLLGALRVSNVVTFDAPVRNQYLRSFSLEDDWARATGLNVRVGLGPDTERSPRPEEQVRLLEGIDGTALGRVLVEPPPLATLEMAMQRRYASLRAFWVTLLLAWGLYGLLNAYRRMPVPPHVWHQQPAFRFVLVAALWWATRYALLALNVPGRWQPGKAPLAPLFDPVHMASAFGGGIVRSIGDLFVTAVFALGFAWITYQAASRYLAYRRANADMPEDDPSQHSIRLSTPQAGRSALVVLAGTLVAVGLLALLATITRNVVFDSTLDYFERTGLLPDRLILIVFCGLLLLMLAVAVIGISLMRVAVQTAALSAAFSAAGGGRVGEQRTAWLISGITLPLLLLYLLTPLHALVPWYTSVLFVALTGAVALRGRVSEGVRLRWFNLRSVLPMVFVLALLLYPMVYRALDAQKRARMVDVAAEFDDGADPRATHGIRQVLDAAATSESLQAYLAWVTVDENRPVGGDAHARDLLQGSLLSTLGAYDVTLALLDTMGTPVGRYYEGDQNYSSALMDRFDRDDFDLLRDIYRDERLRGSLVDQFTGDVEAYRFQYKGLVPVRTATYPEPVGWVLVRAVPRSTSLEGALPFPRVLLPATAVAERYADLSLAEFRDGRLERSVGRSFGKYRLEDQIRQQLRQTPRFWRTEMVKDRQYLTYYYRQQPTVQGTAVPPVGMPLDPIVIAVRTSSDNLFDHLYYLLRLTVAGLVLGIPLYLLGLLARWRRNTIPAKRVEFRDKVLNAFFAVGIITAAVMGYAGLQVVTGENERAVQSWLQQHLKRVEQTLVLEAEPNERPYRVLERTNIDSLSARVGLDLNIYRDIQLVRSSHPRLVRERLIDERLPIAAYEALNFEGFKFTTTQERVGTFTYTAGYRAFTDEEGVVRYIVSVPTLPEQERIEEERSRTVAYLFGSLLVLVLIVMATASLIATRLTRPITQLRDGLDAVAQGGYAHIPPIRSRDEIGELVDSFNAMQGQLVESRRQLSQQERQLAWREMARQVAHEIKNPLTPMKLSIQHMQRAFGRLHDRDGAPVEANELNRFTALFNRITSALIEQTDALARIANEFSSFARMPQRVLEDLDLNEVVGEAVALMQEEGDVDIDLHLHAEPLRLQADREELRRIYINLIKNAIQAIPDGRRGRVSVTTARARTNGEADATDNAWALSTVADNGSGIPDELQSRIFEPNFSTKTSGTGLGLAIVKKGITDLQGDIDFRTEENVGTTFSIRLPLV